eukprot:TRINITY_DN4573_c0_g1_i2.p1 TRINITY_DN4573_c0_g1~~TRINITY_DN4573_c0_g1_i2.p1  ORF type:complete len:398 (+),score=66.18 TRINITY_DN4573_c0_g1_i2:58-1251(+)
MAFRIQHDWPQVVKEARSSFWISCQTPEKTYEGAMRVVGGIIESETDDFQVVDYVESPCRLTVTCKPAEETSVFTSFGREYQILSTKGVCRTDVNHQGELAATGGTNNHVILWSTNTGKQMFCLEEHLMDINTCKFFPSGEVLLTGSSDMRLKIWSATQGYCAATLSGHAGGILGCDFVARGRNLISCSRDGTIRLWDVPSSTTIRTFACTPKAVVADCMVFTDSGNAIASLSDGQADPRESQTHGNLAIGAYEDGYVRAFDLRGKSQVWASTRVQGGWEVVTRLNAESFCAGSSEGTLAQWDLRSDKPITSNTTPRGFGIASLEAFQFQDKTYLCTGYGDGHCIVWNSTLKDKAVEVAGPSFDPIYSCQVRGNSLYMTTRQGTVFKSNISYVLSQA